MNVGCVIYFTCDAASPELPAVSITALLLSAILGFGASLGVRLLSPVTCL